MKLMVTGAQVLSFQGNGGKRKARRGGVATCTQMSKRQQREKAEEVADEVWEQVKDGSEGGGRKQIRSSSVSDRRGWTHRVTSWHRLCHLRFCHLARARCPPLHTSHVCGSTACRAMRCHRICCSAGCLVLSRGTARPPRGRHRGGSQPPHGRAARPGRPALRRRLPPAVCTHADLAAAAHCRAAAAQR